MSLSNSVLVLMEHRRVRSAKKSLLMWIMVFQLGKQPYYRGVLMAVVLVVRVQ